MSRYEVPLSTIYDEGRGPHLVVDDKRIYIIDYDEEPPHDLIQLYETEVLVLVVALVRLLAGRRTVDLFDHHYEEHEVDDDE